MSKVMGSVCARKPDQAQNTWLKNSFPRVFFFFQDIYKQLRGTQKNLQARSVNLVKEGEGEKEERRGERSEERGLD